MMILRALLLFSGLLCAAQAAEVEFFSPQNMVKDVRQAAARFSTAMVAFGDPRLADPFDIDCPIAGRGRWADQRNWVYDFEQNLPAGISCRFTLNPGTVSAAGDALTGAHTFSFSTGGPAVLNSLPWEGAAIDEEQVFILGLDAIPDRESIEQHAWCEIAGIEERVGVRLLAGKERKQVLAQRPEFLQRYFYVLFEDRGDHMRVWWDRLPAQGTREEKFLQLADAAESPIVALSCKRRFPNGAEVRLHWDVGIASLSGIATDAPQSLGFTVRDAFNAHFSCERNNETAGCLPMLSMHLRFSAPIARADAEGIRLRGADGDDHAPDLSEQPHAPVVQNLSFRGPFEERREYTLEIPAGLKDDAGRPLENQSRFPLRVRTDEAPPLVKFPASFGILELNVEPLLPVTLRNVDSEMPLTPAGGMADKTAPQKAPEDPGSDGWMPDWLRELREDWLPESSIVNGRSLRVDDPGSFIDWMDRIRLAQESEGHYDEEKDEYVYTRHPGENPLLADQKDAVDFSLPKPHGSKAFEVIGIPLKDPGFYVVELASPRLGAALYGKNAPYHVQTAALVTNLSIHFLHGRESSLVWVTTLDEAEPVPGARVMIRECSGRVIHFEGVTDEDGIARVAQSLPPRHELPACLGWQRAYVITAEKDGDLSFALSSWNQGIESWRYNLPSGTPDSPYLLHTVFDRTLFRSGETVNMKHYMRRHAGSGIERVEPNLLPAEMKVRHSGTQQEFALPVSWDEQGNGTSTWQIPEGAKQGAYQVESEGTWRSWGNSISGEFRVEAFRVPSMRAVLKPANSDAVNPKSVGFQVQVNYLNGGGAGKLPVKLRGLVQEKGVGFPDYPDFTIANGDVRPGREDDGSAAWSYRGYQWQDPGAAERATKVTLAMREFTLDKSGAGSAILAGLPGLDAPRDLLAEIEYQDANGEILTAATHVGLWPSRYLVGIRPESWTQSRDSLRFQALLLDLHGNPVADGTIEVELYRRVTYSHRKRLVGGFYAYHHETQIERVGPACEGETDRHGRLHCDIEPPADGNLILKAVARDPEGNASYANKDVWVAKNGEWWFDVGNEDRMDLIPERRRYEPGETAALQVRMPFRKATALVAAEREGIIDAWVTEISGKSPVIEFPLKGHYAPNVFASVLAVRGRSDDVKPTALVDLGRPAFRLGIAELKVGWKAHELDVAVRTDRKTYKVREQARVSVRVRTPDRKAPPPGAEVALAVVDEGLLELAANDSWNLLAAMMGQRGIEVETASAQMLVIGKRHFGRKARPAGGGGGQQGARELFDTLIKWQARVPLDERGEAVVEVPLNDSLSSFRVVAVAHAGSSLFGTGQTSIRSTQDLLLIPGLPPLVREGDRVQSGFTVRNTTGKPLKATIRAEVTPRAVAGRDAIPPLAALAPLELTLDAGAAEAASWDLQVPWNLSGLDWDVSVTADGATDRLRVGQKVIPAIADTVQQATLQQIAGSWSLDVRIPEQAIPGRGGIDVHLQPKLAGQLDSVREYMRSYPYTCLEQRVSAAIVERNEAHWANVMNALPAYLDGDGFLKYFPQMHDGSDVLTAYVLAIAHEAGWKIPPTERKRMKAALLGFVQGKLGRESALATADLTLRKLAALEALSRGADPEAALIESIEVQPNLWPTSAVLDWLNILRRGEALPRRAERLHEAQQILRSRLNFQGTMMGFSTERDDYLWWLMQSADVNANRVILSLLKEARWQDDLPRMARGSQGRQVHGHWGTTTANAWGVLAMEKFSARFESEAVAGETTSALGADAGTLRWIDQPGGGTLRHDWPDADSRLQIRHAGGGRPWAMVQSRAAIRSVEAFSSGYVIKRTVTPQYQQRKDATTRGDVWRITLDLEAQSDMTWVVVNDPIPAGASILGTGLGRDSSILSDGEQRQGFVWPAFEERAHDGFRAYYEHVPKGAWRVEYTVRLNNAGEFQLPDTRVEALYAPEMFGTLPNAAVVVEP